MVRPQLLMLNEQGRPAAPLAVLSAIGIAVLGIVPLAAGIAGHLFAPLGRGARVLLFASAAMLLIPASGVPLLGIGGATLLTAVALLNW